MDITELLAQYGIDTRTEGHKHCRPGWANVPCPFCTGGAGYHLGVNLSTGQWTCWRCGWKPASKAVSKLLGVDETTARSLLGKYGERTRPARVKEPIVLGSRFHYPSDTGPLQARHKRYLEGRSFDPDFLETEWELKGTGPMSMLDGINYKHRVVAPIIWEGREVSFQARDITGRSPVKYLACPQKRERVRHQTIFYHHPKIEYDRGGIVVEGITDVWRLGRQAICVFGIEYTPAQVRAIAARFDRVFVVFDPEPQAKKQAQELVAELKFRGVDAIWIPIENGDPGELPQSEADSLVRDLLG